MKREVKMAKADGVCVLLLDDGDEIRAAAIAAVLESSGHGPVSIVRTSTLPRGATQHLALSPTSFLDVSARVVSGPAGTQSLTRTEAQLLSRLLERRPASVETETLALATFARNNASAHNLVHRHLSNIRTKLRRVGTPDALVRSGSGYQLRLSVGRLTLRSSDAD